MTINLKVYKPLKSMKKQVFSSQAKAKISIIFLCVLFTLFIIGFANNAKSQYITNWTISGNKVFVDDSRAYISVEPHTINIPQDVFINITSKSYSGNVDILLGFPDESTTISNIRVYNPHWENITNSYTCQDYFNYTLSPNHFYCYKNMSTNSTSNLSLIYEHDFDYGNISAKTAYWNISSYVDWQQKSDINYTYYNYSDMKKWYYSKNININAGVPFQVKAFVDIGLNSKGKYSVAIKPSVEDINTAISNNHLYLLDPFWNNTWNNKLLYYYNMSSSTSKNLIDGTNNFADNCLGGCGIVNGTNGKAVMFLQNTTGTASPATSTNMYVPTSWFASGQATISMWVNKSGGCKSSANNTEIYGVDAGTDALQVRYECGTGKIRIYGKAGSVNTLSTDVFPKDKFNHIAMIFNATASVIYFNGVKEISTTNSISTILTSQNYIGDYGGADGSNRPSVNITFDEIAVWNRTLTENEIIDLNTSRLFYENVSMNDANVSLISPQNNTYSKTTSNLFNCNIVYNGLLNNVSINIWNTSSYSINSSLMTNNTLNNFSITTNLADGIYLWNCQANNGSLVNSPYNYTITVHTVKPTVNFTFPTISSPSKNNYIYANVTANDTYIYNLTLYIFNSTGLINISNTSSSISPIRYLFNISVNSDGIYFFNATACDLANNCNSTESRNVTIDSTPPTINFISQNPAIITSTNLFNNPIITTYYINDTLIGLNTSSVYMYFKVNNSLKDYWTTVNGSIDMNGFMTRTGINNIANWTFTLGDTTVYPASYNLNETLMETTTHSFYSMTTNNIALVELQNISNQTQYNIFEFMANSSGTNTLNIYYCNSTYSSGTITTANSCFNFFNLGGTGTYNHTHTNFSSHQLIPMTISNGYVGTVKVTPTSKFVLSTNGWRFYNIANIARTGASQISSNNGGVWSELGGTFDAHIHQYNGNEQLYKYVCANDTLANSNCSSILSYPLTPAYLPPSGLFITNPANNVYARNLNINWTAPISPNGNNITNYTIELTDTSENFIKLINKTYTNSYVWNTTTTSDGSYLIKITAYDNLSLSDFDFSQNFTIDNTPPINNISVSPQVIEAFLGSVVINTSSYDSTGISYVNYNVTYPNGSLLSSYTGTNPNQQFTYSNLTIGRYNITLFVNDSLNNVNISNSYLIVNDTIPPLVSLVTPTELNNSYKKSRNIIINVTTFDLVNVSNLTIYLYNTTSLVNLTSLSSSSNYLNISVNSDGIYYFNASATDSSNNKNYSENRIVTIDTIIPNINFTNPTPSNDTVLNVSTVEINITSSDINFANVTTFIYDNNSILQNYIVFTGTYYDISFGSLSNNYYSFKSLSCDLANNCNSTETRTVLINSTSPPSPSGGGGGGSVTVETGFNNTVMCSGIYDLYKKGYENNYIASVLNFTQSKSVTNDTVQFYLNNFKSICSKDLPTIINCQYKINDSINILNSKLDLDSYTLSFIQWKLDNPSCSTQNTLRWVFNLEKENGILKIMGVKIYLLMIIGIFALLFYLSGRLRKKK